MPLTPWEAEPKRPARSGGLGAALVWLLTGAIGCSPGVDEPAARAAERPPEERFESTTAAAWPAEVDPAPGGRSDPRIVSLSPLATRFLVELGVGARIVAVDPASRALPGFEGHPVAEPGDADRFDADYLVGPTPPKDAPLGRTDFVELAPHDLEDVYALCRRLGHPLVGEEESMLFERRIARPLALVAGRSPAEGRPRVVALVGLDPLVVAGGHSFETDLIEIAGGTSPTHGGDDHRRRIERGDLVRFAPDLILVTTAAPLDEAEQDRAAAALGDVAPVVFFSFAADDFWLAEPARDAERLQALIAGFRPAEDGAVDEAEGEAPPDRPIDVDDW